MQFDAMMGLVDSVYDAALTGEGWHEVLIDIADKSRVENAALVIVDNQNGWSSVTAPRADPHVIEEYSNCWWQKDVTAHATCVAPVGALTSLENTGRGLFFASEFYNDFWRRSGLGAERVASNLMTGNGIFASFVLQASVRRDDIDRDTAKLFGALVPHLVRAVTLQRKVQMAESQRDLAMATARRSGIGAMLVDVDTRLIVADGDAEAVISSNNDLCLDRGIVHLGTAADTLHLHRLVANSSTGTDTLADIGNAPRGGGFRTVATGSEPGRVPLQIDVIPYQRAQSGAVPHFGLPAITSPQPAAVLLISDPDQRQKAQREALKTQFGLTPAESAFALEILKGDGREAAAARLGISVSTARTHLSRIFEKTDVRRQAELVRLLSANGLDL